MFLLDAPYVSEFLKQTVAKLGLPVLDTPNARRLTEATDIHFLDKIDFARRMAGGGRVLANSENGLEHLVRSGCHYALARQIDICKDKALFRRTISPLHPEYRFMRAALDELADLDISGMACPFVVKPSRGFFSLGVHVVKSHAAWPDTVAAIRAEQKSLTSDYPEEVVDPGVFIVEDGIHGEEYAIDLYYDEGGQPVITNIMHHHFMSEDDISDRFYYTSTDVIAAWLAPFTEYTARMGETCGFRDFPVHLEVRVDSDGTIRPIEANPLRFAGWCVADITSYAWGFNPYEYYFANRKPDWPELLGQKAGQGCVMVIGDVPPGIDRSRINAVDYDGFCALFNNVLELRRIDYSAYPLFAFVFAGVDAEELKRLKSIMGMDFSRFISTEE